MGINFQAIIQEIDADGNGVMNFDEFAHLAARFLVEEEEDTEAILRELKDAFRLYDKEGQQYYQYILQFIRIQTFLGLGYIGVDLLRDILKELEPTLSPSDLNEMIKEIDTDNSGTVDWEGMNIFHVLYCCLYALDGCVILYFCSITPGPISFRFSTTLSLQFNNGLTIFPLKASSMPTRVCVI